MKLINLKGFKNIIICNTANATIIIINEYFKFDYFAIYLSFLFPKLVIHLLYQFEKKKYSINS